ncbi:MAG: gliding motility-associatede transport system auxiliary component, partial [Myxococcales bacterium]|nr:gliding motility-associatede transport system auxiliary component [Myxococcales bacterium]
MAMTGSPAPTKLAGGARWSAVYAVGMLLVFTGERLIGNGTGRGVATVAGLLAIIAALVVRMARAGKAAPDRRAAEGTLVKLYALGLLSLVLYFVQSDLPTLRGGKALEHGWPKLATALAALWPAVWLAAAWPIVLCEMAYAQMARAPRIEVGRIKDAMLSGLGLAFALVFAFSFAYVTSERDKKFDLAYFRTTRPGESTRAIVRNLDQPVEAAIFFPNANEVRDEVMNYFNDLAKESGQLKLGKYDYDIDPVKAKEMGVSGNGIIVMARGGRKEQLGIPLQIEQARGPLRILDKEVQQRLLMVVKPSRVTFIVQGHGERNYEAAQETDKRSGIKDLREILIDQGHDVRYLGAAEGLAADVPKDASLLLVLGPQKPFSAEETASINRWMDKGGKMLMALDPEAGLDEKDILTPFAVKYHPVMLANDQAFARRTHQDIDRANLVTSQFSVHPSMTSLQKMGGRAPLIMPTSGWLEPIKDRPKDMNVDAPITSDYKTFEDKNGNFQPDPGEERRGWELGAAVTKKDARL